jgi:hypothetical protein
MSDLLISDDDDFNAAKKGSEAHNTNSFWRKAVLQRETKKYEREGRPQRGITTNHNIDCCWHSTLYRRSPQ